jgi:hypothetical protein
MISRHCHHYDVTAPCIKQRVTCYFHSNMGCLTHLGLGYTEIQYGLSSSYWSANPSCYHWCLQSAQVAEKLHCYHCRWIVLQHDSHFHSCNFDGRVNLGILQLQSYIPSHQRLVQKCHPENQKIKIIYNCHTVKELGHLLTQSDLSYLIFFSKIV